MNLTKKSKQIIISAMVIIATLLFIIDAAILNQRFDFTKDNTYKISKVSKQTLRSLQEPVRLTFYICDKVIQQRPYAQTVVDLVNEIAASARGNVELEIIDPIKKNVNPTELGDLQQWQLQSSDGKSSASVNLVYSGLIIRYKDKKQVIPDIREHNYQQIEYEIISRVRKLAFDYQLRVGILNLSNRSTLAPQSQEEIYMCGYNALFEQSSSLYQDFAFEPIENGKVIDSAYKAVVVVGGENIDKNQLLILDQYLMRGGNVLYLVERQPIAFDLENQYQQVFLGDINSSIVDYFNFYGIDFENGKLADLNANQTLAQNGNSFNIVPLVFNPKIVRANKNFPFHTTFQELLLMWPDAIKIGSKPNYEADDDSAKTLTVPEGVKVDVLLQSSSKSLLVPNPDPRAMVDGASSWQVYQSALASGEKQKPYPVSVLVSGELESYFANNEVPASSKGLYENIVKHTDTGKFIVLSDTEFISDFVFSISQNTIITNLLYLRDVAEYLGGDSELLKVRTKIPPARVMSNADSEKSGKIAILSQTINLIVIPVAIVAFALVWLIMRSRKTKSKLAKLSSVKESQENDEN